MTVIEDSERDDVEDSVLLATSAFARRRFRARLRRWRPYLITIAVALVLGTVGWLLYLSSVLTLTSVEVAGNDTVTSARIERIAGAPIGEQLIQVDLAAIQARVERIDAVASAKVSRSWPHTISIQVTERVPIALLRRGEETMALDPNGIVFTRRASSLPPGLPVIEAPLNINAATLGEAARVVGALRSDIAARVERIRAESVDNIVLDLTGGVTVEWGSAVDSDNKARVLEVLLRKDVSEIDVSVPGRPTTR